MFTAKIENLEKTKRLQYNLRLISNLCDSALSKDGMGFNKYDSDNAKSVSNKDILTWNDVKSILHYATKYSKQINLKDIPTSNELWNEFKENSVNNMNIVNNQEITKTDFVNAELIDDIIYISFHSKDSSKWNQIKEFITSFDKRKFDSYTKKWKVTLDNTEINKFKEFIDLLNVTVNSKLTDYLNDNQNTVIEKKITDISDLSLDDPLIQTFNKNLFNYQKIGALFALKNKKCLIGDEMGVGKTLTALQSALSSNFKKLLIVTPATLKYNWKQEIYKHYSDFMVDKTLSVINSNKANKKSYCVDFNSDIVIINYDILDKFKDKLMSIKWDFIINDESHYIKNIKAKRTIALIDIANNSNSQYHLLLTGTPMLNRPKELVTQLQVINRLTDISPSEFLFKLRYCDGQKTAFGWTFDGATHTQELNQKLKKIMIRRTKKEVLTELPDKLIQEVFIDIDNRKEYDLKDKEFELLTKHELLELCVDFLKRNHIDIDFNNSSLVIETMESQFETDYNYFLKQISNSAIHLTRITQLKKLLAHGKLKQAKEFIDNTIDNEKLVVFANHIEIQKALHEMYPNALKIDSTTSQVKRQEIVNEYQNNQDQKLIILSLMSCNAGLTLTSASKMLILEYLWSPLLMAQAQDRIHRIGTKNTVNIYNMIALDTIESQEIYPLLMEKLDTVTQILDGIEIDNDTNMQVSFLKRFIEKRIKAKN